MLCVFTKRISFHVWRRNDSQIKANKTSGMFENLLTKAKSNTGEKLVSRF